MAMRGITGDAHFFEESMNMDRIRKLLDNKLGVAGHSEKLEAMKALLASISKGEDVSAFFADVVKNVIVASVEVKKLVYMYLVHYADANSQCRELALLSINSFQKDLADANQLIRALALRVMTNIRVHDILQIQLIAIRKCAADESPYVRKCAANAISKVFAVDPDQRDTLAEIIGTLLNDPSTMVLGSAMQSLHEVCPDRLDLLHRPFRKICHLLADIDEWGQAVAINVLIRYCRTQFQTPELLHQGDPLEAETNHISKQFPQRKTKRGFYSDDEASDGEKPHGASAKRSPPSAFMLGASSSSQGQRELMPSIGSVFRSDTLASGISGGEELDEDHRLLLRSSIPLLKSRNSAVVLAVATLHYYCGTQSVATNTLIGKSLVRIMRNQREIQYVVLSVIASMAAARSDMFLPFLQDFFVRATDPSYARKLKLEILTALVTEDNVSVILREFQAYVRHVDKSFVTMTVRALGRVADAMPSVAERCLHGLMRLVRSSHSRVVAETVIAIRHILQQSEHVDTDRLHVVRSLAAMMVRGRITNATARASIIWMLGEFFVEPESAVCATETLRVIMKDFSDEAIEVRLQVMNLAVKLGLRAPEDRTMQLLLQYVLELCKFDLDYDVRDRARFIRAALSTGVNVVHPHTVFATKRPAPFIGNEEESKRRFTLGTLSDLVRHGVPGYRALPAWRVEKPDRTLRDEPTSSSFIDESPRAARVRSRKSRHGSSKASGSTKKEESSRGFYSENSSSEEGEEEGSDTGSEDSSGEYESSEGVESDSEYESESESEVDDGSGSGSDYDSDASASESESDEEDDSESEEEPPQVRKTRRSQKQPQQLISPGHSVSAPSADPFDPLQYLGSSSSIPVRSTNAHAPPAPKNLISDLMNLSLTAPSPSSALKRDLLTAQAGKGLHIQYAFLRQPSMYSPNLNLIQLWCANESSTPISQVHVEGVGPQQVVTFPELSVLFPGGQPAMAQLHTDFQTRVDAVPLRVRTQDDVFDVMITPRAGELLTPQQMHADEFAQRIGTFDSAALHTRHLVLQGPVSMEAVVQATLMECNVSQVHDGKMAPGATALRCNFAGRLRGDMGETVLIAMNGEVQSGKLQLLVATRNAQLAQALHESMERRLTSS